MTVRLAEDGMVEIFGVCGSEDAEALLGLLIDNPNAEVDWRGCEGAHAAIIQVLAVAGRALNGPPLSDFLREMVEPALKSR